MPVQTQMQVRRGTASSWTSTNPTLAAGELGFETDTGKFKIGNGSSTWTALLYAGGGQSSLTTYQYTATAAQTTFSGVDANGNTLAYTVGAVQVYLNGALLQNTADYAATNGTSVVLTAGALVGDSLTIISFATFDVANTYTQAQADALFIADTIVDAKGDIIAATAADTVSKLTVGANDTVLTADSSTATGLKWATPAVGGGLTLISEQVFSASTGYSFTSIPSTYKQLYLVWNGVYHSTTGTVFDIRLNNVSTAGTYPFLLKGISGTTIQDLGNQANPTSLLSTDIDYAPLGYISNTATALGASKGYLIIDNYASTTKLKFMYGQWYNYVGSTYRAAPNYTGTFNSTSAITSIDIVRTQGSATMSNLTNTSVRLYGVS